MIPPFASSQNDRAHGGKSVIFPIKYKMLVKGGIPPDQPYWGLWKKSRQEEECYGREEVGD